MGNLTPLEHIKKYGVDAAPRVWRDICSSNLKKYEEDFAQTRENYPEFYNKDVWPMFKEWHEETTEALRLVTEYLDSLTGGRPEYLETKELKPGLVIQSGAWGVQTIRAITRHNAKQDRRWGNERSVEVQFESGTQIIAKPGQRFYIYWNQVVGNITTP